jgi:hypothetical protein
MIPFNDGLFRFGDHAQGMKAYVKKFIDWHAMPTADDCVAVMHYTTQQWQDATKPKGPQPLNIIIPGGVPSGPSDQALAQARLYCSATLLFYYFMHLDDPKRGHPMLPFLDAAQDDLPQWRAYEAAVVSYRTQIAAFLKQPGVQSFPDGRFTYPSNLTPPQPPALPAGAKTPATATLVHLDILQKGRTDDALRDLLRQKYGAMGIKL